MYAKSAVTEGIGGVVNGDPIRRMSDFAAVLPHDGAEKSFKLTPGLLLDQRCLYGARKEALPLKDWGDCAKALGMPQDYLDLGRQHYPQANYHYVGYEAGPDSCAYKFYLEFPVFTGVPQGGAGQGGQPALMYLGLKWDALSGAPIAVTRYVWRVHLPLPGIAEVITDLGASGAGVMAFAAHAILGQCAKRAHPYDLVLLQVDETGLPRQSFDLKLYAANLTLAAIAETVMEVGRRYGIDQRALQGLLQAAAKRPLGHISGGIDRRGREFFTVYYEVQGRG
jgi:hypothetical protein